VQSELQRCNPDPVGALWPNPLHRRDEPNEPGEPAEPAEPMNLPNLPNATNRCTDPARSANVARCT